MAAFPKQAHRSIDCFHYLSIGFPRFSAYLPQMGGAYCGRIWLIHGLAFAETLTNLDLSTKQLLLSIFGFNVGIELMQLVIILVFFPALFLLSKTRYYSTVRQIGVVLMMVMALAWMVERIQEKPNFITEWLA